MDTPELRRKQTSLAETVRLNKVSRYSTHSTWNLEGFRSLAPLIGTAIAAPSSIPNMVWETFTDQGVREFKTVWPARLSGERVWGIHMSYRWKTKVKQHGCVGPWTKNPGQCQTMYNLRLYVILHRHWGMLMTSHRSQWNRCGWSGGMCREAKTVVC